MREILFRGKRTDNGEWVYGTPIPYPDGNVVMCRAFKRNHNVSSKTVGQFTGLTDKNGRKIFEGDVIEFADFFNSEIHRGVVFWCDLAFWFDCTETEGDEGMYSLAYISVNVLDVIGNIYDNPELLEVEQNG